MIGFVYTERACTNICGVTPIPKLKAWTIKLAMLAQYNSFFVIPVAFLSLVGMALTGVCLWLTTTASPHTAWFIAPAPVITFLTATNILMSARRNPHLVSRWLVFDYPTLSFYEASLQDEFAFNPWAYKAYHGMPAEARTMANKLVEAGLQPKIEYLDEDPFLFVELKGKRIYLYHW